MPNPTACLLIIGNEVLSGRTRDANLQFLATRLGEIGIPMKEVRVIPDVPEVIINTVNEVRAKFDHVFTTGGIGPTHDDITSECVARAFGVPWEPQPEAWHALESYYARQTPPGDFNAALSRVDAILKNTPQPEQWMAKRAQLLDDAGRKDEARAAWQALLTHIAGIPNLQRGQPAMIQVTKLAKQKLIDLENSSGGL
jgi:molybdenum cofactor synthesis domain-containing protein